eukprot:11226713-Lingulodinium_polyedra.AAC.1
MPGLIHTFWFGRTTEAGDNWSIQQLRMRLRRPCAGSPRGRAPGRGPSRCDQVVESVAVANSYSQEAP